MAKPCLNRIAFVHYQKAAGSFIDYVLRAHVTNSTHSEVARQEWKWFNSWTNPFESERDWSEAELCQLANFQAPGQRPDREKLAVHYSLWTHGYLSKQYVHNHHFGWNRDTIEEFKNNGWFTFMFLRDPADTLCSTYFWAKDQVKNGKNPSLVFQPSHLIKLSLDEFIQQFLSDCYIQLKQRFLLPEYIDAIDFVAEFNTENFHYFLNHFFDYNEATPETTLNQSSNRGYEHYCKLGQICEKTQVILEQDSTVRAVRELLGPVGGLE